MMVLNRLRFKLAAMITMIFDVNDTNENIHQKNDIIIVEAHSLIIL